jgi:hypothetical protein
MNGVLTSPKLRYPREDTRRHCYIKRYLTGDLDRDWICFSVDVLHELHLGGSFMIVLLVNVDSVYP